MKSQLLNFKNQIILLACIFALCSCEEVKDKLTVDVKVGSFDIVLDDIIVGDDGGVTKSAIVRLDGEEGVTLTLFSSSQSISLSKLDIEVDVDGSNFNSVDLESATITVTSSDEEGSLVEDFLMVAGDIGSFKIDSYELGVPYSGADAKVFVLKILEKLFKGASIPMAISGYSDVVSGESLTVTIALTNVVVKVKVLKE